MFDAETQRKIVRLVENLNDLRQEATFNGIRGYYNLNPEFISGFDELFVLVTSKRGE